MTIKQKRARASRAAKTRSIVKAVKGLLKKTNPSAKITGARVVKLKGGALRITPIKANPSKRGLTAGEIYAMKAVYGPNWANMKGRALEAAVSHMKKLPKRRIGGRR